MASFLSVGCGQHSGNLTSLPTPAALAALPAQPTSLPSPTFTKAPLPTATPPPTATPTPKPNRTTIPPSPTAIATLLPTCNAPGAWVEERFISGVNQNDAVYRIFLPPCYGEDGFAYPALYLLHGNGQSENSWGIFGVDDAANAGIIEGKYPPFLIVTPRGGWAMAETSGGYGSFENIILNELIPDVESKYCAWQNQNGRAIGGISRGGYWALEIAFRHPGFFISAGGHSAALLDVAASAAINPQFTGTSNDLGNLRIYLDVGESDWGSRQNLERLHFDMEAAGVAHEWHLPAGGHNAEYWSNQMENYLNWYTRVWGLQRELLPECKTQLQGDGD